MLVSCLSVTPIQHKNKFRATPTRLMVMGPSRMADMRGLIIIQSQLQSGIIMAK